MNSEFSGSLERLLLLGLGEALERQVFYRNEGHA